jgi:hypothetical protein
LSGGADETSDSMTVETCLKFCQSNGGGAFAGLEYTKYAPNFPLSLSLSLSLFPIPLHSYIADWLVAEIGALVNNWNA